MNQRRKDHALIVSAMIAIDGHSAVAVVAGEAMGVVAKIVKKAKPTPAHASHAMTKRVLRVPMKPRKHATMSLDATSRAKIINAVTNRNVDHAQSRDKMIAGKRWNVMSVRRKHPSGLNERNAQNGPNERNAQNGPNVWSALIDQNARTALTGMSAMIVTVDHAT